MTANGILICYCGECKPEDYLLPSDYERMISAAYVKDVKKWIGSKGSN